MPLPTLAALWTSYGSCCIRTCLSRFGWLLPWLCLTSLWESYSNDRRCQNTTLYDFLGRENVFDRRIVARNMNGRKGLRFVRSDGDTGASVRIVPFISQSVGFAVPIGSLPIEMAAQNAVVLDAASMYLVLGLFNKAAERRRRSVRQDMGCQNVLFHVYPAFTRSVSYPPRTSRPDELPQQSCRGLGHFGYASKSEGA